MIRFDQDVCHNPDAALTKEWLETNGLGGFASSTITGLNTRRYHGLLVAATKPPVGRLVMLSKLEETLVVDGARYELSANQYPGAVHPQGQQFLKEFRLDPFPTFVYAVAGIELVKTVWLMHGANTTAVQYELRADQLPRDCKLELLPLLAFRDYHATMHENAAWNPQLETAPGLLTLRPYAELPALYLAHDAAVVEPAGYWYRNFEYQAERERGLDYREDLFNPCVLRFDLRQAGQVAVIASTERVDVAHVNEYKQTELARRAAVLEPFAKAAELTRALAAAADQFIVKRDDGETIIAGYHWFSDWGRDTMIALPGLTLATGRYDIAKNILLAFARYLDQGMLPNRFPDAGEAPEYNTVDATLWYVEAVRALLEHTGDYEFVRTHLYAKLLEIIYWHERGTRYGIRVDDDGLLHAGEAGVQLTWMDAKVGDWVVTPRIGKPVEIQALWYNALCVLADLAAEFGDAANQQRCTQLAARAQASFNQVFWNAEAGCLYDVVNGAERDASIRPNQIFAVSLPHTMLTPERAQQVVTVVERELLTPCGLRSLAPGDPRYCPRYTGDIPSRDGTYHQGTVWTWLLGPFITAYLKVNQNSVGSHQQARAWLAAFAEHLREAGLGQVSEIFDADAPHLPRGCVAQAWSVAELLRVAVALGR
ncbi:MAG: amylo-alpha-1,6-glucosidase [Acidobacteria bacterium]|nr:amylo-alpha-1,6-glucosidase [Acidobacteriota bacterium]MBI3421554.1 amylo-alpha-1,6-glucosidase [Acidobacteriota bacterium]